ncbi:MAG TPA: methyl-accepting chemotaxis protein [Rectinemataceae bacterium]|nr:methyl-accepting chemotaxis protein [Rectinemataceae bacterium]
MADENVIDNYRIAIERFTVGYNKSVVLSTVTNRSLELLESSIGGIEASLDSIVAAFEEIRATSQSTSANADSIDSQMTEILVKNTSMDSGVGKRMEEVEQAAEDARRIGGLFRELQDKTSRIAEVTGSIRDVSDRTNILAINASIEAARAGSVGKGFRIIANEVRTLAGQTDDFAKQIESTIGEFKSSVKAIDERMRGFLELLERFRVSFAEVLANFQENAQSIEKAGQFLSQISGSIKEESLALTEGLGSLETISMGMKDTHAVFHSLASSHSFLDGILARRS